MSSSKKIKREAKNILFMSSISRLDSLISIYVYCISIYNPFPFKKSKSLPPVQIHIGRYRTRRGVIDFLLLSCCSMERVARALQVSVMTPSTLQASKGLPSGELGAFAHFEDTQAPKPIGSFGGLKSPPSSPSSFSAPAQKKESPDGVWDP